MRKKGIQSPWPLPEDMREREREREGPEGIMPLEVVFARTTILDLCVWQIASIAVAGHFTSCPKKSKALRAQDRCIIIHLT